MKTYINFGDDYIEILGETKDGIARLVYWTKQEWLDDPEVVFSIANAIKLAKEKPHKLLEILSLKLSPVVKRKHPFNDEELLYLFEFSRIAMGDANTFVEISEAMDVSDEFMVNLREKLQSYLGDSVSE